MGQIDLLKVPFVLGAKKENRKKNNYTKIERGSLISTYDIIQDSLKCW